MTAHPSQVRFARRFVLRHPDRGDIHGVELPSGIVIYDRPGAGIEAATSIGHIPDFTANSTLHWADEDQAAIARVRRLCEMTIRGSVRVHAVQQARDTLAALDGTPAHDDGPSVRECAEADAAHWNDKYAGEGT